MTARRALFLTLLALSCLALGWWIGRQPWSRAEPSTPPPEPSIDIRIDAGTIELLPDGGLHLRPIPPLDLDAGTR